MVLLLIWLPGARAQGTRADYTRALTLRQRTAGKVVGEGLDVHWLAGGSRLWFRRELAGGRWRFVVVDARTGARGPAFDHAALAAALSAATGRRLDRARLPVALLLADGDGWLVWLTGDSRLWRWGPAAQLVARDPAEVPALRLAPQGGPRRSTRTGRSSGLLFVNRRDISVRLTWVDGRGQRRVYGTLAPGQRRWQQTYAGHAWEVGPANGPATVFLAADAPRVALVERPAPRRRPRPRAAGRSPDGRWRVRVVDHDVELTRAGRGRPLRLTVGGTAAHGFGGRIFWSPDSRRFVVMRTRAGVRRQIPLIESRPAGQRQPRLHTLRYDKPGDRRPRPVPWLFDAATATARPVDDRLFADPYALHDVRWLDARRFVFTYNERGHQRLRVIAVDADSGEARALVDEHSRTFIDYAGKRYLRFLEGGGLLWMSERDGWNHLYRYDAAGRVTQLTRGPWVVRKVLRLDEPAGQLWFWAGGIRPGEDPYHLHLCRVGLDGRGLRILTEGDGTHEVTFSPDGRTLVDRWSRVDLAPVSVLRDARDGRLICALARADWAALRATGWRPPLRFVAPGRDGKTPIHGVLHRPTTFDPRRRYRVVEQIYAGPHGAHVPRAFRSFHGAQAVAELGFVVVQIDGMGTSQRSKAFHDVCWRNLGDAGFPDRVAWLRAAARAHPWLDTTRVGIYGGSAGGQNAMRALIAHPRTYQVAVADCGCHDNRMDKIWWNELWMGRLGPHYAASSNVDQAHRLQGKLLLIVGELDRNVDPASTMQVVDALIKADKDFDLLVIPGAGHGAGGSRYGRRRTWDFLVRHVLGVEPRAR